MLLWGSIFLVTRFGKLMPCGVVLLLPRAHDVVEQDGACHQTDAAPERWHHSGDFRAALIEVATELMVLIEIDTDVDQGRTGSNVVSFPIVRPPDRRDHDGRLLHVLDDSLPVHLGMTDRHTGILLQEQISKGLPTMLERLMTQTFSPARGMSQ